MPKSVPTGSLFDAVSTIYSIFQFSHFFELNIPAPSHQNHQQMRRCHAHAPCTKPPERSHRGLAPGRRDSGNFNMSSMEISLKMGNSHGLSLDFYFLYRFIAISRGKIWADVGRWWWTSGWNGVTCLQKTHMSNLNQNNSLKVTGGLWETYLRSAVETEWSTASSSAGDSLTIFAKWGHWSSQVQMQPETNITHVSTFIIYVCTYIYIIYYTSSHLFYIYMYIYMYNYVYTYSCIYTYVCM